MAILSRKTLFSLALGGLVSTTAWSQEPVPSPAATDTPPNAAADPVMEAVADRPGVIHVSDCPPKDFGVFGPDGADSHHGMKCPEYVPPTAGWDQPGRRPMYRTWVPYHKFFPNSWTGTAAPAEQRRAPMVYMPTDTTQLGYYYQHVPTWHSYAGMLPPVPRPADWHYIYREPVYNGQPTLAPTVPTAPSPEGPTTEPAPEVPSETTLDRSAAHPDLAPVPR